MPESLRSHCTTQKLGGMLAQAQHNAAPLTYLACPYSHPSPEVMEWRYEMVTKAAAWLIKRHQVNVFSPITHSHPLHKLGGCSGDWGFWKHIDYEYLSVSRRFAVLLLDGWEKSVGVFEEMKIAKSFGLGVEYLLPLDDGEYMWTLEPDSVRPLSIPIAETSPCCGPVITDMRRSVVPEGMDNPKDLIGLTKPPLRLVPGAMLLKVAKVMELGARKYGPYNWREKAVRYCVYLEAAMRHIIAALDGEEIDPESKQPHTAHAAACMGIILDAQSIGKLIDDRPLPGATANLIREMTEKK